MYMRTIISHEIRMPIKQPGLNGKSPGPRFFSWLTFQTFMVFGGETTTKWAFQPIVTNGGTRGPQKMVEHKWATGIYSPSNSHHQEDNPTYLAARRTTQPIWLVVSNIFLCLPRMFGEIISNLRTAHVFSEGLNKKHQLDSDCTDFLVLLGEL